MSSPATPPTGSIYSKEQFSPDGTWQVVYDYMDGERSPLIVSPRVIEVRTKRVFLDLWKSCLDASIGDFTPGGFNMRVSDPYDPTEICLSVDAVTATFTLIGHKPTEPRPLHTLETTLHQLLDQARAERITPAPPHQPPLDMTYWGRVKRWFEG